MNVGNNMSWINAAVLVASSLSFGSAVGMFIYFHLF